MCSLNLPNLPELADDGTEDLFGVPQVLEQESLGGGELFAQNSFDDTEVLAQPHLTFLNRVERAHKLELDDKVDKSGSFLEERVAGRLDQEPVECEISVQDFSNLGLPLLNELIRLGPNGFEGVSPLIGEPLVEKLSQGEHFDHFPELPHLCDALVAECRDLPLLPLLFCEQAKRHHFQPSEFQ